MSATFAGQTEPRPLTFGNTDRPVDTLSHNPFNAVPFDKGARKGKKFAVAQKHTKRGRQGGNRKRRAM
jgi:hypothetical protein